MITLSKEEWTQAKTWLTELAENYKEKSTAHPVLSKFYLGQEMTIVEFITDMDDKRDG